MKNTLYFFFGFFLLTGLVIACGCMEKSTSAEKMNTEESAGSLNKSELRIIIEEFPPFNYAGADGKATGQATEVVNGILKKLNQTAEIEILPWSKGYELAQKGPTVALYSTARTEERENQFKWAGPVSYFEYTFYEKNGTEHHINSLEAAKKEGLIGVVKDDARHQFLLENGFENIKVFESDEECLKSLLAGEISLWLGSSTNSSYIARNEGIEQLSFDPVYHIRTVEMYIAFSPDTPDSVVKEWQDALDEIKSEGTFNEIRQRYEMPVISAVTVPEYAGAIAEQALSTMVSETESMFLAVLRSYQVLAATSDVQSGEWEKISPLLAILEENEPDARTWYSLPDGSYYTVADGLTTSNLKSKFYFPDVISGNESVGSVVVSHSTGRNAGIVAVPVIKENSVAGILGASLYLDVLTDNLRKKIPEPFVLYAIDKEGKFAIHSDKGKISQDIRTTYTDTSFESALKTVYSQKSGTIQYNDSKILYKAYFLSSDVTGWHFVIAWPYEEN